jgi:hypothetical protein
MKEIYRQGDVLFKRVDRVPAGNFKSREGGHILEGEATGHIHRIAEEDLDGAELREFESGRLFLSVSAEGGISIVHEEHDPIALPAGDFEVIRQREYSPEAIRNVAD